MSTLFDRDSLLDLRARWPRRAENLFELLQGLSDRFHSEEIPEYRLNDIPSDENLIEIVSRGDNPGLRRTLTNT